MGENGQYLGVFAWFFGILGVLAEKIREGGIFGWGRDFGMAMEGGMGVE